MKGSFKASVIIALLLVMLLATAPTGALLSVSAAGDGSGGIPA